MQLALLVVTAFILAIGSGVAQQRQQLPQHTPTLELQPPAPSTAKRGRLQQDQPTTSEQPSDAEQRGTQDRPVVVKVLPAEKTEAERAQERADHDEKAAADWWMEILTAALVGVGTLQLLAFIGQIIVFILQATRLRDSVTEMRNATTATKEAVVAARESADAAKEQAAELRQTRDIMQEQLTAMKTQAVTIREQLNVSRDEFNATERPWISIDSLKISSPLFFNPNGDISLSLKFGLVNSGRTPGIYVAPIVIAIIQHAGNMHDILNQAREYCEKMRLMPFSPTEDGILIPPGKTVSYPYHHGVSIKKEDIETAKVMTRGKEATVPYIAGCINYQFTFGERRRHQTGFVYQLIGPETAIILDGRDIPIDKLELIEMASGWAD
jgi:hypothetical protein